MHQQLPGFTAGVDLRQDTGVVQLPLETIEFGQGCWRLDGQRAETTEQVEPGDHERFAHYVRKEKILDSALSGSPVIALCGKVWVPGRDPNKFPVCPICKEIYDGLRAPQDGDKSGGGSDAPGGQ